MSLAALNGQNEREIMRQRQRKTRCVDGSSCSRSRSGSPSRRYKKSNVFSGGSTIRTMVEKQTQTDVKGVDKVKVMVRPNIEQSDTHDSGSPTPGEDTF